MSNHRAVHKQGDASTEGSKGRRKGTSARRAASARKTRSATSAAPTVAHGPEPPQPAGQAEEDVRPFTFTCALPPADQGPAPPPAAEPLRPVTDAGADAAPAGTAEPADAPTETDAPVALFPNYKYYAANGATMLPPAVHVHGPHCKYPAMQTVPLRRFYKFGEDDDDLPAPAFTLHWPAFSAFSDSDDDSDSDESA